EGGCYAKVIRLSREAEPQIYRCTEIFGTILENVAIDSRTRRLDLDDPSLTENTRAAYPIYYIENASATGQAPHPKHIIMLTCDAFGVLPPISRLTPDQAMYHFLSGYTAKVAGTEAGVVEPQATFSTCFGAPFMALPPTFYADLLRRRIMEHQSACWLINTGWIGGGYGVGERIPIAHTRRMVHAALNDALSRVPFETEEHFGLSVPTACPDVPTELLKPIQTWQDKNEYVRQAEQLRQRFRTNFKPFEAAVTDSVRTVM
ncbi:MAG TPA: phosphoenolpyruvate carboxykinase (ATP), partial [Syntrophobacteraceae bacterium]|nr:phosphoenolpyruvate carboxykinase (ATP) [Syntrophobacteraceae bacterium]